MKKTCTILIKKDTLSLGKKGNIKQVRPGYAFNYLVPKGIASIATKGEIKHNKMLQDAQKEKFAIEIIKGEQIKNHLDKIYKINIRKKTGENQQIFGRINEKDIIQKITEFSGQIIKKNHIKIPEIKTIGTYWIRIEILEKIDCNLKLNIIPQDI
uniref:Large ribosomal subunit protein bL9c n=1 Tax=Spyridia filamentosa TaxID=196632 RepID=A0A1Z1MKM3_SPYFI|nr:ribosomal protein L9 [Spyridia filamentosa]ARW66291.1 ribosomal protein L9 [Spyridia filamentosa]